jgi:ferredoxin--NADP+ reductase
MQTSELVEPLRRKHYNATLIALEKIQPELWIFRVRPDEGVPPYKPGQYTTLGLGDWEPTNDPAHNEEVGENLKSRVIRRAYSISYPIFQEGTRRLVPPEELDYYEFYITLVPRRGEPGQEPSLTPRLFALKEGDRLAVGPKITGHYTLDAVEPDDQVILAATGTGEAPHNCMIAHLLRARHPAPIVSIICVRYAIDLGYRAIHTLLAAEYPNYHYVTLTTREAHNLTQKVYIQDLVVSGQLEAQTGVALDPARTHVFLCGNPSMIGVPKYDGNEKIYPTPAGMVEILESKGFKADYKKERGNIHFEEYW